MSAMLAANLCMFCGMARNATIPMWLSIEADFPLMLFFCGNESGKRKCCKTNEGGNRKVAMGSTRRKSFGQKHPCVESGKKLGGGESVESGKKVSFFGLAMAMEAGNKHFPCFPSVQVNAKC